MTPERPHPGIWLWLVLFCLSGALFAQDPKPDLEQQIQELKQGQEEIKRELQELRQLILTRLAARPSGPNVRNIIFEIGDNPHKGEQTAPLTLIEFTDYQCPYCSRHVRETAPQIIEQYVATGQLRYVLVDLPLNIHKLAFKAAEVADCAGEQGKYWEMHDRLFQNQRQLEPWMAHAEAVGLDLAQFQACLDSEKYAPQIRQDMALAQRLGATGTPSFVIARTDLQNPTRVKGLSFIRGARPFAAFQAEIEQALEELER